MANKIIIGILVLIMILTGGVGYYSYTQHQQIEELNNKLVTFETGQTARVDAVSQELTKLRQETLDSIDALGDGIDTALSEIDTLKTEIGATQDKIVHLEDEIGKVKSQADTFEERLTSAVTEFSRIGIDANAVYQKVRQATVRINDAQKNISGSGFIFDTEAHVVTNYHVVENISQVYVTLHDGRVLRATKAGYCPFSDIAVLKLQDNPDIQPLKLADSSQLRIGEPVVAIGSPVDIGSRLDLKDTLTAGIISQINRNIEVQTATEIRWISNLLQFDAAVNPGNSGGPLVNSGSEVIGTVTARVNPIEGDGIYYAVASNKIKRVAAALIAQGSFDYPWLGVGIADLTPQMVQDMALESANGVLVTGIFADSPAQAAGVRIDDIIVSIDDSPCTDSADLTSYLGEFKSPGDSATIGLMRNHTKIELSIEVGKRQ